MANNIVHDHHGHISVSIESGVGTQFQIHLPISNYSKPTDTPFIANIPRLKGRIVVVDDEVSVANFIAEVLRDHGYPTVVFIDSTQALAYLKTNLDKISLLLPDGSMPLISGTELAEYVKAQSPTLPVVFITAYSKKHDEQAVKRIGVNRYLQKPFSIDELVEAVAELAEPIRSDSASAE